MARARTVVQSVSRSIAVLTPGEGAVSRAAVASVLATMLLVALPETVAACPVCFSATEENRLAFLATTIGLSLLPLGMVAGVGLWIRKKARDRGDDPQDPDRPEP